MKQKGFAPILIILVIAIIGVLGYFAYINTKSTHQPINRLTVSSPTSITTADPMGNWKTYTHPSCGANPEDNKFSVQLPSNFVETDKSSERGYSYYTYSADGFNFEISCGAGGPHAGCGETNKEISNNFIVNNEKTVGCMEKDSTNNIVTFNVDYWSSNDKLPRIFFKGNAKDSLENIKLINQILSTFRFIK
jgi:hypothetical protein